MRLISSLAVALLLTTGLGCVGTPQDSANTCRALKRDYSTLLAGLTGKTDVQQAEALTTFLAKHPDDPEDCVTSDARQRLAGEERSIITLRAARQVFHPEWVLPCNSFDPKTASCSGPELDTTSSLPEQGLGARLHKMLPRLDVGTIRINSGYTAKVLAAYGMSEAGLVPLAISNDAVQLAGLERSSDHPILIVFLRCPDIPKYRKVVWHLYPLASSK